MTAVSVWILTLSSSPPPPAIEAKSDSPLTPPPLFSFSSMVAVALYLGVIVTIIRRAIAKPKAAQLRTVRFRLNGTIASCRRDTSSSESEKRSLCTGRPAGWSFGCSFCSVKWVSLPPCSAGTHYDTASIPRAGSPRQTRPSKTRGGPARRSLYGQHPTPVDRLPYNTLGEIIWFEARSRYGLPFDLLARFDP